MESALLAVVVLSVGEAACSQAAVALMILGAAAGAMLALAAALLLCGKKEKALRSGVQALIFLAALGLGLGLDWANNRIAMHRADKVIAACAAYREKTGVYPPNLEALVPDYLGEVPRAKFTLLWGRFYYAPGRLTWVAAPLSSMATYDLAARAWTFKPQAAFPALLSGS